jgi:hypothetical protein
LFSFFVKVILIVRQKEYIDPFLNCVGNPLTYFGTGERIRDPVTTFYEDPIEIEERSTFGQLQSLISEIDPELMSKQEKIELCTTISKFTSQIMGCLSPNAVCFSVLPY